jgi:hypothetical protein
MQTLFQELLQGKEVGKHCIMERTSAKGVHRTKKLYELSK